MFVFLEQIKRVLEEGTRDRAGSPTTEPDSLPVIHSCGRKRVVTKSPGT